MRHAEGAGPVSWKPTLPPFGQFSVQAKWTLKEAAELDPSFRFPTQRGKRLWRDYGDSKEARKTRRDRAHALRWQTTPVPQLGHLPYTESIEGGIGMFSPPIPPCCSLVMEP